MQHLEVSFAVRPLKWSLGVKWLIRLTFKKIQFLAEPYALRDSLKTGYNLFGNELTI